MACLSLAFTPKWCVLCHGFHTQVVCFPLLLVVLSHPVWVCFHCVCPCGWRSEVLCLDHPLCCMLHVWFYWCWCESVHFQHGKLPPSSWSLLERSDENVDSVLQKCGLHVHWLSHTLMYMAFFVGHHHFCP